MERKKVVYLVVIAVLSAALIASLLTYYFTTKSIERGELYLKGQSYEELMKYFELEKFKSKKDEYYIRDVQEEELLSGSLSCMEEHQGDGHSAFYTEEDYRYFDEKSAGSYIGLGMLLRKDGDNYPVVRQVFPGTPAYDAGITAGDQILSVDEKDTREMDIDGVLGRIRGVEGTKAKIVLQSGQETREVELPRRVTDMQMVMTDMINAKVGYVNIVEFSGSAVDDFKKAIASMESEGAQAIVIDLRGNQGGNISQAMEIADLLLDEGQIAYVMGKEKASITWKSSKSTEYDKPIIILTDEQTEGVSEVFAAALQERGRAQILGKKTMGRAVMTSFFEVPSTGNVVKLVTGRYCTAGGAEIDGNGVMPDEEYQDNDEQAESTILTKAAELLGMQ
ncbi:MAG: PDZ domain-containing protein [Clostridiales bacterium]|nr:PDZ domain-containing protein [Clostridiales bacterium]